MKLKGNLKYISTPARIITTILILLIAVAMLQGIIVQTVILLTLRRSEPITKSEVELSEAEKRIERIRSSTKRFLPDGAIHLVRRLGFTPGRLDEPKKEQIYDVNDNLLWEGATKERPYEYLSWMRVSRPYNQSFTHVQMRQIRMITPEFSRSLEIPVRSREKTEEVWRYEPGGELFIGYRSGGGKIGYIGSTGFTNSKSQAKPFGTFRLFTAWCPEDSFSPTLLWQTSRRVYEINFEKRQVQLIFESSESDIEKIGMHKWRAIRSETEQDLTIQYRPLITCLTKDSKYHLIVRNPERKLTVAVSDDWWSEALSFTATTEDIFLLRPDNENRLPSSLRKSPKLALEWLLKVRGKAHKQWMELYRVDNEGGLDLLNRYEWTVPAQRGPKIEVIPPWVKACRYASRFSTPLYDLAWYLIGGEFFNRRYRGNDFLSFFADVTREIRPGNSVWNWLLSVVMMGLVLRHGWPRRTSRGGIIFWVVFTGVFNLAGLLTYWALNHTAVIKCPACGKGRGLGRTDCVHCGVELPAPQRRELDLIFET